MRTSIAEAHARTIRDARGRLETWPPRERKGVMLHDRGTAQRRGRVVVCVSWESSIIPSEDGGFMLREKKLGSQRMCLRGMFMMARMPEMPVDQWCCNP
jgi:hypothetical protein